MLLPLVARPSAVASSASAACRVCRALPSRSFVFAAASTSLRPSPAIMPVNSRQPERSLHLSAPAWRPTPQPHIGPSPSAESALDPGRVVDTALVSAPESPAEPAVNEGSPAHVSLTARAADRLGGALAADPALGALRLAVEPGGCHGYQYKIALDAEQDEDDFVFEAAPGARLVVDSTSLHLIKGSVVDFVTELIGSQFIIRENPQAKGAGCGCGISWEPK